MRTIALAVALLFMVSAPARAGEQRAWVKSIPNEATWNNYTKTISSDQLGKFIIDLKTNEIYFIDVNLFNIHADFVLGVLL